ncbi:MAG: hypothetical protein M0R06_04675 [Sphaerochaeta sp.]|nr:hypothetical protein [Sphaerochaeta sp.]
MNVTWMRPSRLRRKSPWDLSPVYFGRYFEERYLDLGWPRFGTVCIIWREVAPR